METMPPDLTGLRNEYVAHGLRRADLHSDPLRQFGAWFAAALAADIRDVNAMSLATSTPDGKPSVRIVLLKGFDERGFAFFTNYESEKAREIAANPFAALAFYWVQLERQVRISGAVERTSREDSAAYFHSRPVGSRLGAWVSKQSKVIDARQVLDARLTEMSGTFRERRHSAAAALGRISAQAGQVRILARPAQSSPRPISLFASSRWHVADRSPRAVMPDDSLRSRAWREKPGPRYWWHHLPGTDYVPPIYSELSESEWVTLREWYEETDQSGPIGECAVPLISILHGLVIGNRASRIVQLGTGAGDSALLLGWMLRRMNAQRGLFSLIWIRPVVKCRRWIAWRLLDFGRKSPSGIRSIRNHPLRRRLPGW
jgi:pyridoxamine 5'-phosphate oxidase